ncbi:outer membrane protein assembly factor BamE [Sphingomonas sp. SM33]|uniref:Outer membrane protein assembly factor BamE n=1 Tax=Sphingomonas telluris TaxID=2907998 RepID=A0ABS9VQX1_9SPHN|nr:outer membrane protein assembly factor BamE [Sphingomonas telluris]MCH8616802.1 outer membrane protein assembly factor BamE [Sphingomonas telluris]
MKSAVVKVATMFVGAAVLAGCGLSTREHRGYVMDETLTTAVAVGTDNKASVEKTLGLPTFTGTFDQNDWYYVARETRAFAFRNPKTIDQTVLHIRFDGAGNVASVEQTDEALIAAIKPSKDQTPTLGRSKSFFEELFGNIGTIRQPGLPGSQ